MRQRHQPALRGRVGFRVRLRHPCAGGGDGDTTAPLAARNRFSAALTSRNVLVRLVASTDDHSDNDRSAIGLRIMNPALQISASSRCSVAETEAGARKPMPRRRRRTLRSGRRAGRRRWIAIRHDHAPARPVRRARAADPR